MYRFRPQSLFLLIPMEKSRSLCFQLQQKNRQCLFHCQGCPWEAPYIRGLWMEMSGRNYDDIYINLWRRFNLRRIHKSFSLLLYNYTVSDYLLGFHDQTPEVIKQFFNTNFCVCFVPTLGEAVTHSFTITFLAWMYCQCFIYYKFITCT